MLAKHSIDIKRPTNILRWKHRAYFNVRAGICSINLLQIWAGYGVHLATWYRIASHTTAEIVDSSSQLFLIAFAQKINLRHYHAMVLFVQFLRSDAGQKPCVADTDFN